MERLQFTCPKTGREVEPGFESEIDTLLRLRGSRVKAYCPTCGEWHQWEVRDAQLPRAA